MRIKELSELSGFSSHTLRYYEKVGLIQNVERDESGIRCYSDQDVNWVQFLTCMKKTNMPVEELKIYADSFYSNDPDVELRVRVLKDHKERIAKEIEALQEASNYVDHKIEYYENFKKEQRSKTS